MNHEAKRRKSHKSSLRKMANRKNALVPRIGYAKGPTPELLGIMHKLAENETASFF